jgi:cytochrome c oxidase subunit 2
VQHKGWSVLFGVVNGAALLLFVVSPFIPGWWLPRDASADGFGSSVDNLFYLILAITGFFFVLVEALLVFAMWRYAGTPNGKAEYVHGNHRLELLWTFVPAAILLFIAFAQVQAWEHIKYVSRMPEPTQLMEVSARQFEWRIRHPTGKELLDLKSDKSILADDKDPGPIKDKVHQRAKEWEEKGQMDDLHVVNELHTWAGAKVRVALKTRDVIHSFFLPNLRLKQDALPGKTIPVWFEAKDHNVQWNESAGKWTGPDGKEPENWELACAELCGWGHYKMQGRLWVHKDKGDYDTWLEMALKKQNSHEATTEK